jgi:Cu2+-exporting ATPase
VIACPHALGLAIPLVVAISTTLGARSGLLVRDRRGLEEARNVTAVFFDKTGTLTRGEFRVVEITTKAGLGHDEALALAAAVERDSEHTIDQRAAAPPRPDLTTGPSAGRLISLEFPSSRRSAGSPRRMRNDEPQAPSIPPI